jgi:hypothetical protein
MFLVMLSVEAIKLGFNKVKNCSSFIFEGNTDENADGRRHQTLDSQARYCVDQGANSVESVDLLCSLVDLI